MMAHKRKLSENEIKILYSIYGNEVDYEKVRIRKGNTFLFRQGTAFVINNKVHFHEDDFEDDFARNMNVSNMAWLAHEICHVWQYQNLDYDWGDAMEEHIIYGKRVYEYTPDSSKAFTNYRFEQQGAIIQDYYFGKFFPTTPIQEKLEQIIYSTIKKPDEHVDMLAVEGVHSLVDYVGSVAGAKAKDLAEESYLRTIKMVAT